MSQQPSSNTDAPIAVREYSSSKPTVSHHHDLLQCPHTKLIGFADRSYCMKCGVTKTVQTYKSSRFSYGVFFDPLSVRDSQQRTRLAGNVLENVQYVQNRNTYIDFLLEASSKLKFSFNTLHLSIAYLDNFMARNHIPEEKCLVYAASALMLASKTIELDMKIPFISKLKRYTKLDNAVTEFKLAEQHLLKHFNWNLQQCTLIDHMETLLALGVIFATDSIHQDSISQLSSPLSMKSDVSTGLQMVCLGQLSDIKVFDICHQIEKDYLRVANLVVRENKFLGWSERAKAIASILYLRKLCGVSPIWQPTIVTSSPKLFTDMITESEDIVQLFEQLVFCLDPIFTTPRPFNCSSLGVSPNSPQLVGSPQEQRPESQNIQRMPLGPSNQNPVNREERKPSMTGKHNLIQVVGPAMQSKLTRLNGQLAVKSVSNPGHPVLKFGSGVMQLGRQHK